MFVCLRREGRLSFDYCSPPITSGAPGPAFVNIPGDILDPFEMVLEVRNFVFRNGPFTGGFAIIDDIEYVATLCSGRAIGSQHEVRTTDSGFRHVSPVNLTIHVVRTSCISYYPNK